MKVISQILLWRDTEGRNLIEKCSETGAEEIVSVQGFVTIRRKQNKTMRNHLNVKN